jgi:hypothetical protein
MGPAHDEPALFEGVERLPETRVVDAELLAEGRPGARLAGFAEFGAHLFGEWDGLGIVSMDLESQGFAVATGETEEQGLGCGRGAVLDREPESLLGPAQEVAGGVGPGVEVRAAPERLAEVLASPFTHVVDDDEGEIVAAVELAQEAEQGRDFGGAVLVDAVQADEGIEDEEPGPERREGGVKGAAVAVEIEAQAGSGDDVKLEGGEREAAVLAELSDAVSQVRQRVLGEIDDDRPRGVDLEAADAGCG